MSTKHVTALLCCACLSPVLANESAPSIRKGHNLLQEHNLRPAIDPGTEIGRLAFRDVTGDAIYLEVCLKRGPAVFVFLSTKCPLAKRYTARLKRLHDSYHERGLQVFAVFPNSDETEEGIKAYLQQVKYPFPAVRDHTGYVTQRLGATMTPQAFLVDQHSILRYRGAIDDNRYETRIKQSYLVEALDSVLSGAEVKVPSAKSLGCRIHRRADTDKVQITYTRHIARILQDNCQSCHRPGQVAPFSLTNYEEAYPWREEIKAYTQERLMPPWKAAPGFGHFKNDSSLTSAEIRLLADWVDGGAPMGDPQAMPPAPKFNDDWALGEPDLIVQMPKEYVIGPEGEDDYRHFIIPYESVRDRYVAAIDVRPGNCSVVHHVLAYIDTSGEARKLDAEDEGPGYTRFGDVGFQPTSVIGGWAPGIRPLKSPPGTGRLLPKQCDIVLQVHYYRTGVEERDRTKVGIYFSKASHPVAPVSKAYAINKEFVVPAGAKDYEVRAEYMVEASAYLYSVAPHMHLLGKTMQVTAQCPDGKIIPVVRIDNWDFNWQTSYRFRNLQRLPAGTRVQVVATFDNSADNPNNPNHPPRDIGWGEKTTDEMCVVFLGLLRESEYGPSTMARRSQVAAVHRE